MNRSMPSLALASLIVSVPLAAQADRSRLLDQIQFHEYAVMQSSVTPTLNDQLKSEKLALIDDARSQVELGNYRTAEGLLKKVAQNLYRMKPDQPMGDTPQLSMNGARAIWAAMDAMLPQAQRIAREKQASEAQLQQVERNHHLARAELEANDLAGASDLLLGSYRVMKQHIADLRSGERLMIELPDPNSREGWMDAAHRYLDWRYFNRELLSAMKNNQLDTGDIDRANADADQMYDLASTIALQGDWRQAVATVDQAYRILENAWREAGIDVGI